MLTPIGKRILISSVPVKAGTLLVPKQLPTQFQVIAIGDEVTKVKIGDIVYLEKHYGAEIEHEKEKYLVIEEASILAKLD